MAQTNESQEQVTINVETLQPVTRTLMTIGALPTSYLISMTYEEQLLWLQNYLIQTVIPAINNNAEATEEVQNIVMALQDYINDYFDNLDVQEEINNKLEQMAQDGTLTTLIENYVIPYINTQNQEIANFKTIVNNQIAEQNAQIQAVESGSPLVASSTAGMTETDRVYVNTTDGYWYYYNGTTWVQGGVYQATSIQDNEITHDLTNLTTYNLLDLFTLIENHSVSGYNGEFTAVNNPARICTNRVHFKRGDKILNTNTNIYMLLALCDEYNASNTQVQWTNINSYTFANDCYCYITFKYGTAGTAEWDTTKKAELTSAITFEKENSVNVIEEPKPYIPENLITDNYTNLHFGNIVINADGTYSSNLQRLLTKEFLIWDNQKNVIYNSNTTEMKFAIHCFDKYGNKIFGSGWITSAYYIVPECKYFKVQLSKISEEDLDPETDYILFNNLTFSPSVPNEDKRAIANDFNTEYGRIYDTSYVFCRIPKKSAIGKNIKPRFVFTNNTNTLTPLTTIKTPVNYAKYNDTLLVCNSAIFDPSTKAPLGQIIMNGVSIQDETAVRPVQGVPYSDGEVYPLCIDANGDMSAPYLKTVTTSEMINDGVKYCCVGWIKLVDNFEICTTDINAEDVHKNERLPQQIVGQFQNGDYFVFSSDGDRGNIENEQGLLYTECANFLISRGVKFAYAFDGGGSVATVKEQRLLTAPFENRTVPILLEFYIDE